MIRLLAFSFIPFAIGCGRPVDRSVAAPASASAPASAEVPLQFAKRFRIEKRDRLKYVFVHNVWRDSSAPTRYVLVPKGVDPPADAKTEEIVRTPVGKFAAMSTTHLPAFDELGRLGDLVGFSDVKLVNNPNVREGMTAGRIKSVGGGRSASVELIASLGCEVFFVSDFSEDAPKRTEVLRRLGVQVVSAAEFGEDHPLGRAEWLKFFAAFFDEEERASKLFRSRVHKYERLAALARKATKRPTVLLNAPFRGTWHVPGGKTHAAKLLADAGADYLWADEQSSASLPLQFEAVLAKAAKADYWLNPGQWSSLADARREDQRYELFDAFRIGAVYNSDLKKSPDGGADYWETGVNHPERVLADLIAVFHPDLLPDHKMNWYRKLP